MKKLLLLIGCVLFATTIFAQERGGGGQRGGQRGGGDREEISTEDIVKRQIKSISKEIALTDDENLAMTIVLTEQAEDMKTLMEEGSRPSEEDMMEIKEKHNARVKALLGDVRFEKYVELQEAEQEERESRQSSGRQGSGGRR